MPLRKQLILGFWAALVVIILVLVFLLLYQPSKIGVVQTSQLLENYHGFSDAQQVLEQKTNLWKAEIDTLESDISRTMDNFGISSSDLDEMSEEDLPPLLLRQISNYQAHLQNTEQKRAKEEEILLQGVLNQVNSYVAAFAEAEGYDLIIGTVADGNVLYAGKTVDVTEAVLSSLNRQYQGYED